MSITSPHLFLVPHHLTSTTPKAVSQTYEWNLFCLQLKGNGYNELYANTIKQTDWINHPCHLLLSDQSPRYKSHVITIYSMIYGMILIRFQFLINVNSISIISWVLLSISITISITKTGPYQYQYIINFSKFSLSISMPISILHFFLINISLSMHCATLMWSPLPLNFHSMGN